MRGRGACRGPAAIVAAPWLQRSERLYLQDSPPFTGPRPLGGGAGERLAGGRKRALSRVVDVRWACCDHGTLPDCCSLGFLRSAILTWAVDVVAGCFWPGGRRSRAGEPPSNLAQNCPLVCFSNPKLSPQFSENVNSTDCGLLCKTQTPSCSLAETTETLPSCEEASRNALRSVPGLWAFRVDGCRG